MEHEERWAGRGIIVDTAGAVLMIGCIDPADRARGRFWLTPGGGIEPGETLEVGTARELWEEVGLTITTLGKPVLHRIGEFCFGGRWIRQVGEYFFIAAPDGFVAEPKALTGFEAEALGELRWFSTMQLRALEEPFYPWCLADLVDHIGEHGPPDPPWTEEQLA